MFGGTLQVRLVVSNLVSDTQSIVLGVYLQLLEAQEVRNSFRSKNEWKKV